MSGRPVIKIELKTENGFNKEERSTRAERNVLFQSRNTKI
jgi:hypothetical protein